MSGEPVSNFQITIPMAGWETKRFLCTDRTAWNTSLALLKGEGYPVDKIAPFMGDEPKTILDIGANMGAFSVLASIRWPGSRILAFEPGNNAFSCMNHNLDGIPGAQAFHFGLGKGDHRFTLHPGLYGTVGDSVGQSSAIAGGGDSIEVRDAGRVMAEQNVDRADILKLDSEGCEVPILLSMGALTKRMKIIFVEYHSEDDRRAIDNLLAPSHHLFLGEVLAPHRGEFCYVSRDLEPQWKWDSIRIDMPQAMSN